MKARIAKALGPVVLALVAACSSPDERFEPPRVLESNYTETGDLDAIAERGKLRLLVVDASEGEGPMPPAGTPLHAQLRVASGFARSLDLEPVLVAVDHFDALVSALKAGRGDVIVTNQRLSTSHYDIARTIALTRTRQVLAKRAGDSLSDRAGLAGRTITVAPRSSFWDTARRLQDARPALTVEPHSGLSAELKMELLSAGEIELTILNRNRLDAALAEGDRIAAAFPVSDEHGITFGLRRDAPRLKAGLDRYIQQRALAEFEPEWRTGDLDAIEREGTLRVATRNDAALYFVWRGRLMGFEYELAKRFADHLGVRLEVVVGEDDDALRAMVRQGRADFAAAFLMREAGDHPALAYSRPYHHAVHQVVTDVGDERLQELNDLAGRTLHVRKGSDAWQIARGLRDNGGLDVAIEALPAEQSVSRILSGVADGDYDLTIADDHIVRHAMAWNDRVQPAVNIGKRVANRWAFRAGNPGLLAAANDFLDEVERSEFYNVVYAKYFDDQERIRRFRDRQVELSEDQLSPYDDLLREYAAEFGFDWRLLAAQVYQESNFNPAARSWAGAVGLLQVMPPTARQIGVTGDLEDPATNLRAGIEYLDWLRNRFEEDLSVHERTWFMLAAYNAGAGHVRDARELAARLGLDPDRWFDHVEQAMLKLADREHFRDAPFGYVRGQEPVDYVRDIRARFQAYRLWAEDCAPDCGGGTADPEVEEAAEATPASEPAAEAVAE